MMKPLCLTALWAFALQGCALAVTSGPIVAGDRAQTVPAVTFGAHAFAFRKSAGTLGARLLTVADDGLQIRSGAVHVGYAARLVPGDLVIEPGIELGAGSPANIDFGSAGAYAGFVPTIRVRITGVKDSEPAFNLMAPTLELVILGRAGAWMPPEGSRSTTVQGEFGLEVGLRFAIGSDLFAASQGKVGNSEGIGTSGKESAP